MRKRRHLGFIIHGARADLPAVRHLVSWVREKGHAVRPRVTWEAGDGAELTRDLIAAGVDTVVACGGDGTVNEVLNGMRGSDVPLGIIPIGTANDFARQTGIPDDADHAMDVVLRRRPVRIDTATLNGRRFLNVSSGGIGAEATAETPADAKETLGPLAYFLTGLRKLAELEPRRGRFDVGDVHLDLDFLLFAVANARATGGGTLIAPRARVQDGLLDVVIVEHMPRRDFARLVLRLKKGEHLEEDGVHYLQVPRLHIETELPVTVNVDGEPQELSALTYESQRGDLLVHLPHLPEEADDEEEEAAG